jgi:hypothetical protein
VSRDANVGLRIGFTVMPGMIGLLLVRREAYVTHLGRVIKTLSERVYAVRALTSLDWSLHEALELRRGVPYNATADLQSQLFNLKHSLPLALRPSKTVSLSALRLKFHSRLDRPTDRDNIDSHSRALSGGFGDFRDLIARRRVAFQPQAFPSFDTLINRRHHIWLGEEDDSRGIGPRTMADSGSSGRPEINAT